jgi:hypothetical protein
LNVLAVPGKLLGGVDELSYDDPTYAARRRYRYQEGNSDGWYAADPRSFEERDDRRQNERQNESKCQGNQNFAGKVQHRDGTKERNRRPVVGACEVPA